ncbi:hypothetical protein RQP46_004596 [Phenoliferia psychrophenolica]
MCLQIQKRASYSVLAESSGLANSTVPTTIERIVRGLELAYGVWACGVWARLREQFCSLRDWLELAHGIWACGVWARLRQQFCSLRDWLELAHGIWACGVWARLRQQFGS